MSLSIAELQLKSIQYRKTIFSITKRIERWYKPSLMQERGS